MQISFVSNHNIIILAVDIKLPKFFIHDKIAGLSPMNIYLSLIVPCYNEGEHLEKSFPKVVEVLQKLKQSFEIIIIDDHSRDNTAMLIDGLIKKNKEIPIRFIKHKKNVGRGGTVTEGIKLAKGEIVGLLI